VALKWVSLERELVIKLRGEIVVRLCDTEWDDVTLTGRVE